MSATLTKFTPALNGFQFVNRFEFHFPVKYNLPIVGQIDLNDVVIGLCGGMSFSALDYFYAGAPLPAYTDVTKIDPATFIYLCNRQLDSLQIPVVLKFLEWMVLDEYFINKDITGSQVPKLRRMLDKGDPAVLGLVHVKGLADPGQNHQVVAIGYTLNADTGDLTIQLYDPNYPNQNPTIQLNISTPRTGLNLVQSTGETLRGFFVIPYTAHKNVPTAAGAPGAPKAMMGLRPREAAPTGFKLQWPVDSTRINQPFGANPAAYKGFGLPGHEGLDLFAITGANVYAAADGMVYQAGFPPNHPYGRHIRIRHEVGGKVYHTIYAHLSSINVQVNQNVAAGDLIGHADNTGNSFGSHLHLTLKIEGEQTPGYPPGIVDPQPYLQGEVTPKPAKQLPPPSGVTVFTTIQLNLREGPDASANVITILPSGESLTTLGDAAAIKAQIGVQDRWLQVQTASGQAGFVAAWFVQTADQPFPPSDLVVYPYDTVNLRSGPGTGFDALATLNLGDPLTVLGDASLAQAKLGQQGAWLQVQTQNGLRGFVAAWLVHLTGQKAPSSGLAVNPIGMVNVRALPSTDANVLTVAQPGDALTVLGDKTQEQAKIGIQDQWLNVQAPGNYVGYVAAWLVQIAGATPAQPQPGQAGLQVAPTADVNLRAQPSVNSPRVDGANMGEALKVVESDLAAAKAKIGGQDQWLFVEKADGSRGWVAAWFVSAA